MVNGAQGQITQNLIGRAKGDQSVVDTWDQRVGQSDGTFNEVLTIERQGGIAVQINVKPDGGTVEKVGKIVKRRAPEGPAFSQDYFQTPEGETRFLGTERPL